MSADVSMLMSPRGTASLQVDVYLSKREWRGEGHGYV